MKSKLYLNKEIYAEKALLDSIIAFERIAEISVQENSSYYCLEFKNCKVAASDMVIKEFGNYVLAETIKLVGNLYD